MSLEKIVDNGIAWFTLCSSTLGSFAYGVSDAKGVSLPGRMYVWPATGLGAFYLGRKIEGMRVVDFSSPRNTSIYLFTTVVGIGVISYGLGYATGKALDLIL